MKFSIDVSFISGTALSAEQSQWKRVQGGLDVLHSACWHRIVHLEQLSLMSSTAKF